jgi:thiol-disulfide isomerase/thioredoxin
MNDIAFRILITLALAVVGFLVYVAFSRFSVRQAEGRQLGLEGAKPGVPTVLYFTTPYCAPCRTIQAPALEKLAATYGDALQVIKIDADEQPDVASHWGVMTVPTTYVFDRRGKPRFFNPGIAKADKLEKQLMAAGLARH